MQNLIKLILVINVSLLILGGAIACSPLTKTNPAATPLDVAAIRAYADNATETTIQGLSENNLAKYTQYFNPKTREAVTLDIFQNTAMQINNQFGTYISKEFLRVEELSGYIVVHYKAKYSKGEIGLRMVFDKDNLIAGQWFE